MSWQATNWVIQYSKHKGSALLTLLMIANCANDTGTDSFPGVPRLAKDTRLSLRQVQRILRALEASGEIEIRRKEGQENHYAFPFMTPDILSKPTKKKTRDASVTPDILPLTPDIATSPTPDTAMSPDPSLTITNDPSVVKTTATKSQEAKGTRIPEDFTLTADMRAWAKVNAPSVDPDKATEEFIDYWTSVPGAKGRKLNWPGTWRNRMRELEQRASRYQPRQTQTKTSASVDAARQVAEELRREAQQRNG